MVLMKIPDRPAVGDIMALESPFAAKDALQEGTSACGLSVDAIVSAHDRLHMSFLHACLKSREVGFLHILDRRYGVELMAECFRP